MSGLDDIAPFLARKYAILGQQADAATTNAGANVTNAGANVLKSGAEANLYNANAGVVAPNARALQGLQKAQTGYYTQEAEGKRIGNIFDTGLTAAATNRQAAALGGAGMVDMSGGVAPTMPSMLTGASLSGVGGLNTAGMIAPKPSALDIRPISAPPSVPSGSSLTTMGNREAGNVRTSLGLPHYTPGPLDQSQPLAFSKGTSKVPGKGSGKVDTVPAKLAPGEAVLNKGAAEHVGRGLIDQLNSIGMQKMGMVPGAAPQGKAAPAKGAGMPPGKPQKFAKGTSNVQPKGKGGKGGAPAITPQMLAQLAAAAGPQGGMQQPQGDPSQQPVQGFAQGTSNVQQVGMVPGATQIVPVHPTMDGAAMLHALALGLI